jgi:hypothetical protein
VREREREGKNGWLTHGTVKAPGSTWQWCTEREREPADRVQPVKKEIYFEYRKLFSIQHRTENNSKEIVLSH